MGILRGGQSAMLQAVGVTERFRLGATRLIHYVGVNNIWWGEGCSVEQLDFELSKKQNM